MLAAGKPHCGQQGERCANARVQTEQIPQWLILSGIRHSQHKPGTDSMGNFLVKKENPNR